MSDKPMKEASLEEMMQKLEECVSKMESSNLSLDESFEAFKEGMDLVKMCNDSIDKVEKQVVKLMDDGSELPLDEQE